MLKSLAVPLSGALLMLGSENAMARSEPLRVQAQPPTQTSPATGQRGGRQQGRPATLAEAEQRLRGAIARRLREELELPDTLANRLAMISFRFRDSALVMYARDEFLRRELRFEASTSSGRVPNEARITCLVNAFMATQQQRFNLRAAEDRQISQLVNPLRRYRYLAFQENLHDLIDDAVQDMNRRFGRRGGGAGPADSLGRAGGPPGRVGGGPGGRGPFAMICPRVSTPFTGG